MQPSVYGYATAYVSPFTQRNPLINQGLYPGCGKSPCVNAPAFQELSADHSNPGICMCTLASGIFPILGVR